MLRETESSNNLFYHSSHSSVDDDLISRGCARKAVESVCSCIPCVSGAFVPEMRGRSWADVGSSGRSCPLGQPCWCAPSSDFSHCQGSAPSNLIDKMAAFRVIGAKVDGRLAHPNHTPRPLPTTLPSPRHQAARPGCVGAGPKQAPFRESISAQPKVLPVDRLGYGSAKTRQKISIIVSDWHSAQAACSPKPLPTTG